MILFENALKEGNKTSSLNALNEYLKSIITYKLENSVVIHYN
jgi:hypothetical protein